MTGSRTESLHLPPAWRRPLVALLALALTACVGLRETRDVPEVPLPAEYKNALAGEVVVKTDSGEGLIEWWRYFGNRELEALIDRSIANNPDIRIATVRVVQAKARADQARGGQVPTITAPLLGAVQAPGGNVGLSPSPGSSGGTQRTYQASLKGEYRLDIWGERSGLAESAELQLWRAVYERDNTQRNVAAAVASYYVDYVSLNDRLRVARETAAVLSSIMTAIEKRVEAGDATLTELEQQKAGIHAVRATIPSLEQQREDAANSIAFLVGTVPGSLRLSDVGLESLSLPSVVPGLPAALLLRRPDVRMAEARLLSADADIDVARARILPPVDLSAQAGYSSAFLNQLFQPKLFFWNTLANLTVTIFDSGKREQEKRYAEAAYEEMVETYIRTIYQAMREVESALATIRLVDRRLEAQREATVASRRAWDISTEVYAVGGVDYLTLLDTERTYHRYLDEYQRLQMEHYRGYVSLFQSLGGGVRPGASLPGDGARPAPAPGGEVSRAEGESGRPATVADGVTWGSEDGWQIEEFWQVELPGIYHRAAIGAAWRDLRARYPEAMTARGLRPRVVGRVDESPDGQEAWYRLYVAKFASPGEAEAFCRELQQSQQRCRVISSRSDESLPPTAAAASGALGNEPVAAAGNGAAAPLSPAAAGEAWPKAESGRNQQAYTVQLASFANLQNAAIAQAIWKDRGQNAYVSERREADGRRWFDVRTGVYRARPEGAAAADAIRQAHGTLAVLVPVWVDQAGEAAQIDTAGLVPPSVEPQAADPAVPEPPEAAAPPVAEKTPAAAGKTAYAVQLGAFSGLENAALSHRFWQSRGYEPYVSRIQDASGRDWYAVRIGAYPRRRDASALALVLGRLEDAAALVVPVRLGRDKLPPAIDPREFPPVPEKTVAPEPPQGLPATRPLPDQASSQATSPVVQAATPPGVAAEIIPTPVPPTPVPAGGTAEPLYAVQLGIFTSPENAAEAIARWRARGIDAYAAEYRDRKGQDWLAVRAGAFARADDARQLQQRLRRQHGVRLAVVRAAREASGGVAWLDLGVSPGKGR